MDSLPPGPNGVRRFALALVLALIAPLTLTACTPPPPAYNPPVENAVVTENRQLGTDTWRLSKLSDDVRQQVKGYASAVSVNLGESIKFFVTVNPAQPYSIDIYRFGYYNGLGGRLMKQVDSVAGRAQPACRGDTATGMVSCNWLPSYAVDVPPTWTSGVYLAKLTNQQ